MNVAARTDKLARVEQVDKMTTLVMVKKLWQKSRKIGYEQSLQQAYRWKQTYFWRYPKKTMWDKPRIASVLKAYLFCRFDTIPASDRQMDTGPQHIVLCTGIAYASRVKNNTSTLRVFGVGRRTVRRGRAGRG